MVAGCHADGPRISRPVIGGALLQAAYLRRIDSLDQDLTALAAVPPDADAIAFQQAFRRARTAYKRIEYLVEYGVDYDDQSRSRVLNRPALPTVNEDDPLDIVQPTGFQVIEEALFPQPARNAGDTVRSQVELMRRVLEYIKAKPPDPLELDRRPFDAARLEIGRITTLGFAGFDATLSKDGIRESAEAFRGVADGLQAYEAAMRDRDPAGWDILASQLAQAIAALDSSTDFERFDRLGFLTRNLVPIGESLDRLRRTLALPPPKWPSPWSPEATSIYARGALNSSYFAPDYAPVPTPRLVALGRRLFFDPSLSRLGKRSCATCHQPARAYTDGRTRAQVDPGTGFVRNTPTLLNAGLQAFQFADQRVPYLEFQVGEVMTNPREMDLPPADAAARLQTDSALVEEFAMVFGALPMSALTEHTLRVTVAAFVRSLQGLDSRFDRAVQGDVAALTQSERDGFNLFMGKAACGTCHFAPLFGGTLPPNYLESEPEVIGVPASASKGAPIDPDPGAFAVRRAPLQRHAFKTPSLRNVAVTAPYMHNGVFGTLEEVVDFYDGGGGAGLGMRLPNQTLAPDRLHLTAREKRDLVAFLGTLTDSAATPAPVAARHAERASSPPGFPADPPPAGPRPAE